MFGRERRTRPKVSKARRRVEEKHDHDALRERQAWFCLHPPGHIFKNIRYSLRTAQLYVLVSWCHKSDPDVDLWEGDPKNYKALLLPFGSGPLVTAEWNEFGTTYVEAWQG